jgi:hypothetical protein
MSRKTTHPVMHIIINLNKTIYFVSLIVYALRSSKCKEQYIHHTGHIPDSWSIGLKKITKTWPNVIAWEGKMTRTF